MIEEEKEQFMYGNNRTFDGIKSATIWGKIIEFPESFCLISSSYLGKLERSAKFAQKVKSRLSKKDDKKYFSIRLKRKYYITVFQLVPRLSIYSSN